MRMSALAHWRTRWFTGFFVIALLVSLAFGGIATRADDPPQSDNTVGGLGAPPATPVPTATTAPTVTVAPAATTAPTAAPTTAASTPADAAASPAAAPAKPASGTPATADQNNNGDDVGYEDHQDEGGGGKNIVKVQNKTDNRLRVKAKIQLNRIPGDNAQPENYAEAYGSCTNCQTFAVALQIDLISRTATTIAPQNAAVALNVHCSHCTTYANAIQYVVQVDDPTQVPENVKDLIGQMQKELNAAAHTNGETAASAQARIDGVITQFNELGQSLYRQHAEKTDDDTPNATVAPDATVLTPTPTTAPQDTPVATAPASPIATP